MVGLATDRVADDIRGTLKTASSRALLVFAHIVMPILACIVASFAGTLTK